MGSPRIIFKGGSIMSKKYEKNDVNENIVNDIETEVITEVTDEAEAPVEVEVIEDEKKPGFFKRTRMKASKVYNEGVELPPLKNVVKGVVKTLAIAAAGAGATMLVLSKLKNDDAMDEDGYTFDTSDGSEPEEKPVLEFEIPMEIEVTTVPVEDE